MVSCLGLISNSHILANQAAGVSETGCGLSIAAEHVQDGLFAVNPADASCPDCLRSFKTGMDRTTLSRAGPKDHKSLVERLIARINQNDDNGLALLLGDELARRCGVGRLNRLHQMFPDWSATIDDSLSEGDKTFLRYSVNYVDRFGLIGPCGSSTARGQAVVFRFAECRVVEVDVIRDDFGFWAARATEDGLAQRCSCHPGA